MHIFKKGTSLFVDNLSVVSYFFPPFQESLFLYDIQHCRICTACCSSKDQYFTGIVIRKKDEIRGFSVFFSVFYMFSLMFFSVGIIFSVKEPHLRLQLTTRIRVETLWFNFFLNLKSPFLVDFTCVCNHK